MILLPDVTPSFTFLLFFRLITIPANTYLSRSPLKASRSLPLDEPECSMWRELRLEIVGKLLMKF